MSHPLRLVALTAHARSVAARDRVELAGAVRDALGGAGLVLETCHRIEAYAVADPANRLRALEVPAGSRWLTGEAAIRHAMAVAVGRDSVVLGEDQILHQVRETVDAARRLGALDPALERLFATALRTGRRARSWGRGPSRSLAAVAIAEIERRAGPIAGKPVLIVGAGRMGRLAARAATEAGATSRIASRTRSSAEALARDVHGRAVAFDPGAEIDDVAGTIVALAGPWPIAPATRVALATTPAVVDLSVPAAIPGDVDDLAGRLVTADDLARRGDAADQPDAAQLARLTALIDGAVAEFLTWIDDHERRAAAAALARRADRVRQAELDALWRRLPDADPRTRAAIESMARHFADQLLREPLERLGNDPDGSGERAVREAFAL